MSAAPVPEDRQPARAGPVDDAPDELGVARAPHDVRPDRRPPAAVGVVRREREQLGGRLGPRVVPARACRVGRRRRPPRRATRPAWATDGDETCTNRRTPAARGRVEQRPRALRRSRPRTRPQARRCRPSPRGARRPPGPRTRARAPRRDRSPSPRRRARPSRPTGGAAACARRHRRRRAARRPRRPSMPLAPVTRTRHSRARSPASTRAAQAATRSGRSSSCAACRSAGSGTTSTAATSVAGQRGAHRGGQRPGSATTGPCGCSLGLDDDDDLLRAARPDADDGRGARPRDSLARCSSPTGVTTPRSVTTHVREPPLDPQPTVGVEVADVARAVPARVARRGLLGEPEPVVAAP